ncbi:MAG: exodeoxyribonuclease III [Lachnospiraceae bacterium]|nr:exodeoxyribonuclease III [Lachnospiraceae bacterium]
MKIISWNVAGFRACYKKGLEEFFDRENADIYCFQETKMTDEQNPMHKDGYKEYLYPAEKKGYSGVMVYTKTDPMNVTFGIGDEEYDSEGRVITLEFENFYLVNCYVPNSKRGLERLDSRMRFEDLMRNYLLKLSKKKNIIYCGDLNVAHEEIDIKNASSNRRSAGFTDEERNKMTVLLESGFIDTFRYLYPEEVKYSWWSYFGKARENNVGWRIDYFIVNKSFADSVKDSIIYTDVLGSDHCPIGIELK